MGKIEPIADVEHVTKVGQVTIVKPMESKKKSQKKKISRSCCDTIKYFFSEWLDISAVDGITHAARAKHVPTKILWISIVLAGVLITLWQVYWVLMQYWDYPIVTSIQLTSAKAELFPSVTVCNKNRIHCGNLITVMSHVCETVDLRTIDSSSQLHQICTLGKKLMDTFLPANVNVTAAIMEDYSLAASEAEIVEDMRPLDWGESLAKLLLETGCNLPNGKVAIEVERETTDVMGNVIDESYGREAKFLQYFTDLPMDVRKMIGHSFQDFVRKCTFKGSPCSNASLWYTMHSPMFGNCFVYNHRINAARDPEAGQRLSAFPRAANALTLTLDLDQDNYMKSGLTEAAGATAVIVHPADYILPSEKGLDLSPSTKTSAALKVSRISRLPHPWPSKCINHWNQTLYDEVRNWNYSMLQCQRVCIQVMMTDTCNCSHPTYADEFGYVEEMCTLEVSAASSLEDRRTYQCVQEVFEKFDNGSFECQSCFPPCHETHYETTLSSSLWPTKHYWPMIHHNYEEPLWSIQLPNAGKEGDFANDDDEDYYETIDYDTEDVNFMKKKVEVEDNLLRLDVYFHSSTVTHIVMEPQYTPFTLLSDLGGALGLVLGVSIAMLFEFVELLINICFYKDHHH